MVTGNVTMDGLVVKVNGQQTTVSSGSNLKLSAAGATQVGGGIVQLGSGSGCLPVALLGGQVLTPVNPVGTIQTGSSTVCASQ